MRVILVANSKGGSGKSTVATHLAAYYAGQGERVLLADADRQLSALAWLSRRPDSVSRITGREWAIGDEDRIPKGEGVMVLDSPANLHGKKLTALLRLADQVVVPVQPSPFDMWASREFFARMAVNFQAQQDLIAGLPQYRDSLLALLDALSFPAGATALEVGPGDGGFLPDLARRFNISHENPHRAAADATATAGVLREALARARELALVDLGDLYRLDHVMAARDEADAARFAARAAES